MGLDTVELVMTLEEEFGIEIPNEDAARLATVGEIADYILARLASGGGSIESIDLAALWVRVKSVVVRQLGVAPDKVTRTASVVQDLGAD